MNKILLLVALFFIGSGCSNKKTDFDKIQDFIHETHPNVELKNYKKLVSINEEGDCINCNNTFSRKMGEVVENKSILFILSGNGTKVDISAFVDSEHTNVIWDYNNEFGLLKLATACTIYTVKEGKFSNKVTIKLENLNSINKFVEN